MTRHEVRENLLVALDTLRARKIRSALTILGIVIGGVFNSGILATGAVAGAKYNYSDATPESLDKVLQIAKRAPATGTGVRARVHGDVIEVSLSGAP